MLGRLAIRTNVALSRYLPEQRVFLRSDTEARYVRLSPTTQALIISGSALLVSWSIIAAAVIMMEQIGAGSAREQARRDLSAYATRLDMMSVDRDRRVEEARMAQQRFALALGEVSKMQSSLLASEDRRRELETGIEVIQTTLSRTMRERDAARAEAATLSAAASGLGTELPATPEGGAEMTATLDFMTGALAQAARDRDAQTARADKAAKEAETIAFEKRLLEDRNDQIFSRLEEAVTVSMEPLDKMFTAAGMDPDSILNQVRQGYSGQGGPLIPVGPQAAGGVPLPSAEEMRANRILEGLDRMNLYRLAVDKTPFGKPVAEAVRFTSGFGSRNDPLGAGRRMHNGSDFAGPKGTPILATADGEVIQAGRNGGFGLSVTIRHAFGVQTLFAHMSKVNVTVGQRVSRGDQIGGMGNTGRSTGTHLHYEVHVGKSPVNPMTFIKAASNVF